MGQSLRAALILTSLLLLPQHINETVHQALMERVVLETDPRPTLWKIQVLLEKMARSLSLLTLPDLENFIAEVQVVLKDLSEKDSQTWF